MDLIQLDQNDAAFSIAVCQFASRGEEWYVIVGTGRDVILGPHSSSGGSLILYQVVEEGRKLKYLHTTPMDDVPVALQPFNGRLLVGVGKLLRIYDIGKKKMLRKCENKHIPNLIVDIKTIGNRVYVSDVQESVHYVRYRPSENQLVIFADDTYQRFVTATCLVDYDTVATADKFGNIAIVRLPSDVSDEVDEDPTGNRAIWDRGLLNGASQKAEMLCHFYIGETVLSLQKTTLIQGGSECLVYSTLSGAIGILVPFTSKEDIQFFQHLEMYMRQEHPTISGRDHLHYRSYYVPVKNVIDGDLCEQYNALDYKKKKSIAEDLDRTPNEVAKKLEDTRTRFAF